MLGNISIWQLLIVLVIVMLVFGTKKLRGMGGDLGGAVSGFKKAMKDGAEEADKEQLEEQVESTTSKVEETTNTKA